MEEQSHVRVVSIDAGRKGTTYFFYLGMWWIRRSGMWWLRQGDVVAQLGMLLLRFLVWCLLRECGVSDLGCGGSVWVAVAQIF